ncbi:MAG: CRISPR-associated protein Cas5 [Clostridiales bacterium]|nr:CRISPR-associated protein Cas5 [Clostridiales bacterium]
MLLSGPAERALFIFHIRIRFTLSHFRLFFKTSRQRKSLPFPPKTGIICLVGTEFHILRHRGGRA